jgi:translation initiation factor 3 subunit L
MSPSFIGCSFTVLGPAAAAAVQSFCQYRCKVSSKSPEELAALAEVKRPWSVVEVLNVLQALVDKSGIVAELEADDGAK